MATPLPIPRLKRIYYLITGLRWFAVALPLPLIYLFMGERGLYLFEIGVMSALATPASAQARAKGQNEKANSISTPEISETA
jgi:hypothetical protein